MSALPLSLDDVHTAESRIRPHIRTTPMLESEALNKTLGFRLLVKAESMQITGAFKIRGAFNNLLQFTKDEKRRGVFAMSAGNHAQGIARAAAAFGVPAVILMPHDAPQSKIAKTHGYGAEVMFYNRDTDDRETVGRAIAAERDMRLVHSFDDLRTIAGQGTLGLEIHRQCGDIGVMPNAIIVNCSGGGLTSGVALSRDLYRDPPQIYTAEPESFDDAVRSLAGSVTVKNTRTSGSICDALLLNLGSLTLPIMRHHQVRGLTASDDMVRAAMSLAADEFKLVLEPGGAVALATACLNRKMFQGQTVVAVASGGNVDADAYADHIRRGLILRPPLLQLEL